MGSKFLVELSPGLLERVASMSDAIGIPPVEYLRSSFEEFARMNSRIQEIVSGSFSGTLEGINVAAKTTVDFAGLSEQIYESFRPLREASLAISKLSINRETLEAFQELAHAKNATASLIAQRIAEFSLETDEKFKAPDASEVIENPAKASSGDIARIEVTAPSVRILRALMAKGASLAELHWRELEILVAGLLEGEGYEVELRRGTKDGGADILARKFFSGLGQTLSVWQAKHSKNAVGIATIRELADTRNEMKASKGVIVTTSHLTRGALGRIQKDQYLLEKVDGEDLEGWILRSTLPPV